MGRNKKIKRKEDLFITTTLDTCGLVTPKEIIPLFDERIKYDYDFYRDIELEIIYDGKIYTEKDVVKCYYCLLKKEVIGPFELKAYKQSFHNIGDEVYIVDDTNYENKKINKHIILDVSYKEFKPLIKNIIHSDFVYFELKSEFLEYDKRLVKKGYIYSITAYDIDYKLDNGLIYSGEQLFKEIK